MKNGTSKLCCLRFLCIRDPSGPESDIKLQNSIGSLSANSCEEEKLISMGVSIFVNKIFLSSRFVRRSLKTRRYSFPHNLMKEYKYRN